LKFIHTADIHLDSPLTGLAAYRDAPAEMLRTATRDAFRNLVAAAIDETVDFVIIAGDLYDGTWRDYNTGYFFAREMGRLHAAGIPVFLLYGNHDAESEMTRRLALPPNVRAFDTRKPSTFRIEHLRVALHGRSFRDAATTENLAVGYPDSIPGWLNIGVLHTALEGNAEHASYAPCSLAQLVAKGYDYWALGHVHDYAEVCREPWVVYPGNTQGRHIRETGARGAVLVSATETGIVAVERLFTDVLRWHRLTVDLATASNLDAAVHAIAGRLQALLDETADGKPLALRVVLQGRSTAHGELFGKEARLRAETLALAAALAGERIWIEKVRIETTPAHDRETIRARADAIADLQALLDEAPGDREFLDSLTTELRQLVDRAPHELAACVPEFAAIRSGDVSPLVAAVAPGLIAYLMKAE